MKSLNKLFKNLSECTGEDVGIHNGTASVYTDIFRSIFNIESNRIFNCDGYWELPKNLVGEDVYMLTEYKYGRNLKNKLELCKVLAQCVYYINALKNNGMNIPKVVFVGDENECITIPAKVLMSALDCGSDFSKSASTAASDDKLMDSLLSNTFIDYAFVYDVDEHFDVEGFVRTIINIAKANDEQVLVEINEHNIEKIWRKFKEIVFGNSKKVGENEQVSIFVHYITDHNSFFRDPRKPKNFIFNGKEYTVVDAKQFTAFCNHFGYVRSVRQKEKLRATCDRFIEDTNRRMKGEFYTPTAFVDYAHDMISKEFGEDWKEKYVVWDCAWGTGNLTRDYKFKELYCSTLEQAELDIARNVNPEATKFQFDFLNDDFEKLPEGLQKAFKEGKKILFLINPPYGTAVGSLKDEGNHLKGKESVVSAQMKTEGLGSSSKELYGQFLYRILKLKEQFQSDISLALFCNPRFLTGSRFAKFRKPFLKNMRFVRGSIFNASHFADVSSVWGISFNLWRSGESESKTDFPHRVLEMDGDRGIIDTYDKPLYNTDGMPSATTYWKTPVRGLERDELVPAMNNALSVVGVEKMPCGFLGSIYTSGTSCSKFTNFFYMLTGASNHMGNAVPVMESNVRQCCDIMAAVKLAKCNWLTDKDELMIPNTKHPQFDDFSKDAIVFSIFNGVASSMREVDFENRFWNIKNEFFWMSRNEVLDLADNAGFEELYNDAKQSEERFVYKKLQTINLSEEAQAVLDKASEIVKKSFKYRQTIHESHPEYHLNAWDAGWYQIKKLCAELPMMKDDMEEFKRLFKRLSDKMRPMVYELGFLKR